MKLEPCRKYYPWLIVKEISIEKVSSLYIPEVGIKDAGILEVVSGPEEAISKKFVADIRMLKRQTIADKTIVFIDEQYLIAEIIDLEGLEVRDKADLEVADCFKPGNNAFGDHDGEVIKYGKK